MTAKGKPRTQADRERQRRYREKFKEETRAYQKKYHAEYRKRPYVREKERLRYHEKPGRKEYALALHRRLWKDPAFRAAKAAYDRKRRQEMKDAKATHQDGRAIHRPAHAESRN